jgi:hypothetical protein
MNANQHITLRLGYVSRTIFTKVVNQVFKKVLAIRSRLISLFESLRFAMNWRKVLYLLNLWIPLFYSC